MQKIEDYKQFVYSVANQKHSKMKKNLNYICIALIALALFSCNKNEWTTEKEADFKKEMKEGLLSQGKGIFSDEQATHVADCVLEKIKSKNLKPNDSETPENIALVKQMGKECAQEVFSKTGKNTWDSQTESQCKAMLKAMFLNSGVNSSNATFLVDCAITKIKEQNLSPADLQNPKNGDLVQKIGKSCGEELMKKK